MYILPSCSYPKAISKKNTAKMVAVKVQFLVQTFAKKIKTSILAFETLKTKIDADKTFIFRETVF